MMNIAFLDADTVGQDVDLSPFEDFGKFTAYPYTAPEQTAARLQNQQVAITNKVVIDKEVMDQCPALRLVCIAATGMNNVDLDYAREKNIAVENAVGYSTESVVQVTFGMILQLINHIPYYDDYVKQGAYARSHIFAHFGQPFHLLSHMVFGIIGLGNIGRQVAQVASAFGAKVVYYSTSGKNTGQPYEQLPLDELLRMSDIVSVHAPLNEYTRNLIGEAQLARMKPRAMIFNVGRGGIIEEAALASALDQGVIAGAGVDVYTQEPIREDNPLLHLQRKDRLVLAPHIAWAAVESRKKLIDIVYGNIREFIRRQDQ